MSIPHRNDFAIRGFVVDNETVRSMPGTVNNDLLTCIDMLTTKEWLVGPKAYFKSIHLSKFSDIMFTGHHRT